MPNRSSRLIVAAAFALPLALAGCHVHSGGPGDNNVDISTPFGGMQVKDSSATTPATLGLTAYPGAVAEKHDSNNSNSGEVNFNFGKFKMRVLATAYVTTDATDKVLAFYRKDLARYGVVLLCKGSQPVGQPTVTGDGLTCSSSQGHGKADTHSDSDSVNLRAGSPQHQHIVGVSTDDGHTKIEMVVLDLPKDVTTGDSGSE